MFTTKETQCAKFILGYVRWLNPSESVFYRPFRRTADFYGLALETLYPWCRFTCNTQHTGTRHRTIHERNKMVNSAEKKVLEK